MHRFKRDLVRFSAAFAVLLVSSFHPASAEEDETSQLIKDLRLQIELLQDRVAALERQTESHQGPSATSATDPAEVGAQPAAPELEPQHSIVAGERNAYLPSRGWLEGMYYGSDHLRIETHAFIDLEYSDAGPDGRRSGVSTFDNHHANLFLRAHLRPNLLAHAEFEFEHGGDTIEVDQAYLSWGVNKWLTVDAGRFYTPFGIERFVWYSPTNAMVSRPEPMRQIIPGNFYANGIMAAGNLVSSEDFRLTYEVAVTDGLGDDALADRRGSRQNRDNNSSRAVTGRAAIVFWPSFEVGFSAHTQRYDSTRDLDIDFFGMDVAGRWKGWELRGEYVEASVDRSDEPGGDPALEQDGWYAQLGYTFQWVRPMFSALTLATRYDSVDLDASFAGNDDRQLWSLGLNTVIHQHFRLKAEYRSVDEDGVRKDDDEFLAQFVIDF